jgi:phosphatidate cytidylyltransferase
MQEQNNTNKSLEKSNSLKRETIQRVISAFIVAPFVVFCFVSYPSLVGLVATIVMISSGEFFFTTLKRHDPWLSIIYTALVTTYPVLYGIAFRNNPMELLAAVFMVGAIFALSRVKNREIITEIYFAYSIALIYISFLLSFFIPLYDKHGAAIALLTLTLSWSYDSFAYAFGMTMGKHKFGSYYSPNKSWEGFYGGVFGTFVYILIYQFVANNVFKARMHIDLLLALILAFVTGIFDTFGDIFESSIKRHYGVKHMGNLMPGHGGMLDRIDGLLFMTPVIYIVLNLLY